MRGFCRFGQRKLPQLSLQAAILVTLPIVRAIFRDIQQRSHSDRALTRLSVSLYPIPVSFFSSVRVLSAVTIGECSYSSLRAEFISQFDLYEQVHRSPDRKLTFEIAQS
jgi:hypothetical protein